MTSPDDRARALDGNRAGRDNLRRWSTPRVIVSELSNSTGYGPVPPGSDFNPTGAGVGCAS